MSSVVVSMYTIRSAPHGRPIRVAPVAVAAGFPSPAQDYYDGEIDLTEMLVEDQDATFIIRVSGGSMENAGISDGDELLVDRSKRPRDGDVVVAVLDGQLTVKRLHMTASGVVLRAESDGYTSQFSTSEETRSFLSPVTAATLS